MKALRRNLYIKGLVNKVNEKYKNETRNPHIAVYGTGRNTQGLIRFVDSMINQGKWKHYEKFWLMYDKDDFPFQCKGHSAARADGYRSTTEDNDGGTDRADPFPQNSH